MQDGRIDGQVIQQRLGFRYLGANVTSFESNEDEMRQQVAR